MERRNLLMGMTAAITAAALPDTVAAAATADSSVGARQRVHIVLFDGVEELDFAAPLETLDIAGKFGAPIETRLVTVEGPRRVTASCGTRIDVGADWMPGEADVILVPGGDVRDAGRPGVAAEIKRGVIPTALRTARRRGLTMASVCTGALLLGAAGLVRGRPCTTHHGSKKQLAEQGGKVVNGPGGGMLGPRVVDDGDLVTSAGVTSGLELALWLVQRAYGTQMSMNVEMVLEYERRGVVHEARRRG
ncbi:DJ-1/PfpI family protein [Streptosporangium sp. NPDC003464]